MHRSFNLTKSIVASIILHVLFLAAVFILARDTERPSPMVTPIDLVRLPQDEERKLPPTPPPPAPAKPVPFQQPSPSKPMPPPEKFGSAPDIALPKTTPASGLPDGSDKGTKADGIREPHKGPLPFLSQADIDELARKGMPQKKPGEDAVTLDTDEFKFISYNRWLKVKVESVLKYPELAAVSGMQGALFVQFDILKDGSIGSVEVIKPSGYKILDDEATRAIRSAAPFQPLPDSWGMDHYTIRAAVLFFINEAYIR